MHSVQPPCFECEIRRAVDIGNPRALNDLIEEMCDNRSDLIGAVGEIVASEYKRRLNQMSRDRMLKLYKEFYIEQRDANKDWLLAEVVDEIIQQS